MTEFPEILLERVSRVLVGVRNSRKDPHCRSRAAMAATDFYLATREAAVCREERAARSGPFSYSGFAHARYA